MTDAKIWHVEMFGGLRVCRPGGDPVRLSGQQTGTLFAFLALHLHRTHSREALMSMLWPDDAPEDSSHKLRQSLYMLRRQLGTRQSSSDDLILATRTTVQLNPASITTDVVQFEQALQLSVHCSDGVEKAELLQQALRLYKGELLCGFYLEECEVERRRLSEIHRSALSELSTVYEKMGNLKRAIEAGIRLLALDPLVEEAHCNQMRQYASDGQLTAVERQYKTLVSVLKKELDSAPLPVTTELMETLRRTTRASAHLRAAETVVAEDADCVGIGPTQLISNAETPPQSAPDPQPAHSNQVRDRYRFVLAGFAIIICCVLLFQRTTGHYYHPPTHNAPSSGSRLIAMQPTGLLLSHSSAGIIPSSRPAGTNSAAPSSRPMPAKGNNSSQIAAIVTGKANGVPHVGPLPIRHSDLVNKTPDRDKPKAPSGSILWSAAYALKPGDKSSEAVAIAAGSDGCTYVTGIVDTKDHDVDYLTLKYDESGNILWEMRYDGPAHDMDRAVDIAVDGNGDVYVTGESDGGKGRGATHYNRLDIATVKYNGKTGEQVGCDRYDGMDAGEDRPVRIKEVGSSVYVLGKSWSRRSNGKSGFGYVLVTYDLNLKPQHTYRYDEGEGDNEPVDMAVDRDGSIYVTGQSAAFGPTGRELDILTIKYLKFGWKQWEKRYGANNQCDDSARGIGLDGDGNVYVVGTGRGRKGTLDESRTGCITIKYDADGHELWARGTSSEDDRIDMAWRVNIASNGEVTAYGTARDSHGAPIGRVVRRDSTGVTLWHQDVCSLAGEDGISAIARRADGVFLCGGIRTPGGDPQVCTVRYDNNGNLVWSKFFNDGSPGGCARAFTLDGRTIAAGKTTVDGACRLVVVKYQP